MLAVALAAALVVGASATTYAASDGASAPPAGTHPQADESTGGEGPEGGTTPEPQPPDAVLLTADADPHEARINELYEVDWYRFVARPGQDYWIVANVAGEDAGIDVDLLVLLYDTAGAPAEVAGMRIYGELRWVRLVDAEAGTYYVRVAVESPAASHVGAYGIEVRTIDDDHGNTAADGTVIDLASALEYSGKVDYESDVDWLVFNAEEGDLYNVAVSGWTNPWLYMVVPESETKSGSDEAPAVESLGDKPWRVETSGLYALRISYDPDIDQYPGDYSVTFEVLTDDHPNVPSNTAPLRVGGRTVAVADHSSDEDWFHVELTEGESYVVEISAPGQGQADIEVGLYGVAGVSLYNRIAEPTMHRLSLSLVMHRSRRVWQPSESGTYLVHVRAYPGRPRAVYPVEYVLTIRSRPLDDHADGPERATALRPDTWVEANLDLVGDEDWYRFAARAGVAYTVEYSIRADEGGEYVSPDAEYVKSDHQYGDPYVGAYFLDGDWGFDGAAGHAYATTGDRYVVFSSSRPRQLEDIDYRFRLVEHERVDYADSRVGTRRISVDETVVGSATSEDSDWFSFDAEQGGIYTFSSGQLQSQYGKLPIVVFDGTGEVPSLNRSFPYVSDRRPGSGVELWTAPEAGRYWIRISGKWSAPHVYRMGMTFTPIEEDDHGDDAAGASVVALVPQDPVTGGETSVPDPTRIGAQGVVHADVEGRLGSLLDTDVFALRLERGVKYRITPRAPVPGCWRAATGRGASDHAARTGARPLLVVELQRERGLHSVGWGDPTQHSVDVEPDDRICADRLGHVPPSRLRRAPILPGPGGAQLWLQGGGSAGG